MTIQDLLAMTPSPKTTEGARRLYFSRRWKLLGSDGKWLWGEFEINSPKPLRATVDMLGANFYCSCKSRYRPCTHALSLVMILKNQQERITVSAPTEWVLEIQETQKAQHSPINDIDREATPWEEDPKMLDRLQLMSQGIDELELRLLDIASQGIADTNTLGKDFWIDTATRLTDAKLGGLANRLRTVIREESPSLQQQARLIGDLYLSIRSWRQLDQLPEKKRSTLLQFAGINLKKDHVLINKGKSDHWLVMGYTEGQEDKLRYRRVWLKGEQCKRYALLLEYAFGERAFERSWPLASSWQGQVHYYPGNYPQRAMFPQPTKGGRPYDGLSGYDTFSAMLNDYRRALAFSPWLASYPVYLMAVEPINIDGKNHLLDTEKHVIPIAEDFDNFFTLLAASTGNTISVFAEYTGDNLRPLSLFANNSFIKI